jgi:hypothetical protein
MKSKQLTVWEAACIVTGYGIGGGVLAMPYLTAKNGVILSFCHPGAGLCRQLGAAHDDRRGGPEMRRGLADSLRIFPVSVPRQGEIPPYNYLLSYSWPWCW